MNLPNLQTEFSSSHYGQLPNLSCFNPIEVVVESLNVKSNKSVDISKETQLSFPAKREELLQISNEPNPNKADFLDSS